MTQSPEYMNAGDRELASQLAGLPRSVAPRNDQWQRIEKEINPQLSSGRQRKHVFHPGRWAIAASVLIVLTAGLLWNRIDNGSALDSAEYYAHTIPSPGLSSLGARVPADSIEREYQAAFKEFRAMEMMSASTSSGAKPAFDNEFMLGWETMRTVEKELLQALDADPENSLLVDRLVQLRSRQLKLLHAIADSGLVPGGNLI
jgi:hypothetical protein